MNQKMTGSHNSPGHTEQYIHQDIVDSHPDMILNCLPEGTLIFANNAYCSYVGKQLDELIGNSCLDNIHPDDREKFASHLSKFSQEQSQATIQVQMINARGKGHWHHFVNTLFYNKASNQRGILSIGRDVTYFKNTEIELHRRIAFEHLITQLSTNFINLRPSAIDNHINNMLSEIGKYAKVDRSYVFVCDYPNKQLINSHEWCAEGIKHQILNLQNTPFADLPWLLPKLQNFDIVHISKVADLPPEAQSEKKAFQAQKIQSLVVVPVVHSGDLLGFTGFDAVKSEKTWSEDEVLLLRIVGGIFGSAIVQKQNLLNANRHVICLEKLNHLSLSLINASSVQEMLDAVVDQICDLIGADGCLITMWDEKTKCAIPAAASGILAENRQGMLEIPELETITATVLNTEKPFIAEDIHHSPYFNPKTADILPIKSLLVVPIIATAKRLGALLLAYHEAHHLNNEEIILSEHVAAQLSQSCLKLLFLEQAKRTAREAKTLHKTSKIITSTLEPEAAIQQILDQLERVVPFDSASIQILGDGFLEIKAGKGWPCDLNVVGVKFPVPGNNPNTIVVESRQPCVLNDVATHFEEFNDPHLSFINAWLGVPLLVHNRVIGMLSLSHHQPNFYDDEQLIDLATAFADQVAISLQNAQLYTQEHQRVMELDALRATTADITKELGLKNLISAILERATVLLNATGGELGLLNKSGDNIHVLISHNMGSINEDVNIKLGEGLMGIVSQTKKIEIIDDYSQWDKKLTSYKDCQIHAAIAAPLMIGKRFFGVIGIMSSDPKKKFTASDKSLMNLFAQQAAIAVENAKLFEELKHQARIDMTTNIYNRRGLYELGNRELARAKRYDRPLAILMLDIDKFKIVNDTFGHATGDLILQELAGQLTKNLRTIDVLGRYGGEEFVALLPETTAKDAYEIAERLRETVAGTTFDLGGLSLPITISIGVTITTGNQYDLDELIKIADEAMYRSKAAGRNRVTIDIPSRS